MSFSGLPFHVQPPGELQEGVYEMSNKPVQELANQVLNAGTLRTVNCEL